MKRSFELCRLGGHSFFKDLIRPGSGVLDLGANKGGFSLRMSQLFGCICYAVEPTRDLYDKIPDEALIRKEFCAVTDRNGPVSFSVTKNREASRIGETYPGEVERVDEVPGMTLESLVEKLGLEEIDLIKMDIEGAEVGLFAATSDALLGRVGQICVEFHDGKQFGYGNVRDVRQIKRRLAKLGFLCLTFSRPYNLDVLFVNRAYNRLRPWEAVREAFRHDYMPYVERAVRRRVARVKRALGQSPES